MAIIVGHRLGLSLVAALLAGLANLVVMVSPAAAAIITVTGTGDTISPDGFVTLREAITAANTNASSGDAPSGDPGLDTITFNISGLPGTVHTIAPNSALPTITDPVTIDGYTQFGATANTLAIGTNAFLAIELNGENAGFSPGLLISAGPTTVRGLVINRFSNEGILVVGASSGTIVEGNFLGTDQTGQLDRGNGVYGIAVLASNVTVGGTALAARNLISGNDFTGIRIGPDASGVTVQGNYIGTTDNGTASLGNTGAGVRIDGNVSAITIGGTTAGAGNRIAFNSGANGTGVSIVNAAASGVQVRGNEIFSNASLGIDINPDANSVNQNDVGDVDVGPNNGQNFPVITSASSGSSATVVRGTLDSVSDITYAIDLYSNAACDPSGNGEGEIFLGSTSVLINPSNPTGAFSVSIPVATTVGRQITATATRGTNPLDTSEFSACRTVTPPPGVTIAQSGGSTDVSEGIPTGDTFTIVLNARPAQNVTITFATGSQLQAIAPVTFTPADGDWNSPRTITVVAVDDALVEGPHNATIVLAATSGDADYNGLAIQTVPVAIVDDDAGGAVSFGAATISVPENAGSVAIPVQRSGGAGPTASASVSVASGSVRPNPPATPGGPGTGAVAPSALGTVTVSYATADGTSKAGQDYVATAGTLTFGVNETTMTITIPILADNLVEGNEQFTVTLSNPTGGAGLGQPATITVVIVDTTHASAPPSPGDDSADDERVEQERETEEERRQRARTNQGNRDDDAVEGDVIEVRCDQPWPAVAIANRDGTVEVKLIKEAQKACSSISVGDYLEADGEKQHEGLFHADSVEVKRRR